MSRKKEEIPDYENDSDYKECEYVLTLIKDCILFYIITKKTEKIKGVEKVIEKIDPRPVKTFILRDIKQIFIFDYSNKILIKTNSEMYSVMFRSSVYSLSFISHLNEIRGDLPIMKCKSIELIINENENNDQNIISYNQVKKEKINIKNRNSIQNAQNAYKEVLKDYLERDIKLSNAIVENLYQTSESDYNASTNCFNCPKQKRIFYFTKFYLYEISENPKNEKLDISIYNNEVKINNEKYFKIENKYTLSNIKTIQNDFNNYKMALTKNSSLGDKKKKEKQKNFEGDIIIEFNDRTDMFFANFCFISLERGSYERFKKKNVNNEFNKRLERDNDNF